MPVYSTLETIKEAMTSAGDYVHFKILDQDDNLMTTWKGLATTTPADAFNNLEAFVNKMSGEGYVIIKIYLRNRKFTGGGDTANDLKFYYRLGIEKKSFGGGGASSGIDLAMYLNLLGENQRLQTEIAIKEITAKYEKKEVKDTSYLEKLGEAMAKTFAKEFKDKAEETATGYAQRPLSDNTAQSEQVSNEVAQTVFKRTGNATARLMKLSKQYGGSYEDIAESIENIAAMAERDPIKLQKLMEDLKAE